jgi:uncharacterized membrane protein
VSRIATIAAAIAGLAIASYLTVVHYTGRMPVCAIAHGCATVQKSSYAELLGVPVAVLGLLGYAGILASLVKDTEITRSVTAVLAVAGMAFSAWLTSVEVFRLHAICIWCVGSALCMTLLAALAATRLLTAAPELRSPVLTMAGPAGRTLGT